MKSKSILIFKNEGELTLLIGEMSSITDMRKKRYYNKLQAVESTYFVEALQRYLFEDVLFLISSLFIYVAGYLMKTAFV